MKKYLAMLCATMMCVCCLGLAACGGGSSSSAASSASTEASSSAAAASEFVGEWQMAAMETQGVTVAGDLSAMLGDELSVTVSIKDDGTGTITLGDEGVDMTWEEAGEGTMTATIKQDSSDEATSTLAGSEDGTLEFQLEGDRLLLVAETEDGEGTMVFTHDGQLGDEPVISVEGSTPVTSEDQLVGTWNLGGLSMMGMMAYGDAESIAAMAGGEDMSLTFEEGGTAIFGGSEVGYVVDESGAKLVADMGDGEEMSLPVTAVGDDIIVDYSELLGMEMLMLYTK